MKFLKLSTCVDQLSCDMSVLKSKISEIPYSITENFYELVNSFSLVDVDKKNKNYQNNYKFNYNYFDKNHQLKKVNCEEFKDVIVAYEDFRKILQEEVKKIENYLQYTSIYDNNIKDKISSLYTNLDNLDEIMSIRRHDYEKYKDK